MAKEVYNLMLELRKESESFVLWVDAWDKYTPTGKLNWTSVPFKKARKNSIPDEVGIYAFVVAPGLEEISKHGYLLYIGIAGSKSENTLRKRFQQYFYEQKNIKRPGIHFFLNKYEKYLYFVYSTTPKRTNIKKLERQLLDVYQPPYNTNDFSATIKQARSVL